MVGTVVADVEDAACEVVDGEAEPVELQAPRARARDAASTEAAILDRLDIFTDEDFGRTTRSGTSNPRQ
jgi:hypothetical protein